MEMLSLDKLRSFLEKIKSIGFWGRLFGWGEVRRLSYDAYEEYKTIQRDLQNLRDVIQTANSDNSNLRTQLESEKKAASETVRDKDQLNQKATRLSDENSSLNRQITEFETRKKENEEKYERKVEAVNSIHEQLENAKKAADESRITEINDRLQRMKQTWQRHEKDVENLIRGICKRHQIEYIDKEKTPFRGKPDNTIQICGEYIIFDAKSPESDDLSNFQTYIKTQAENQKKYATQENVKKEVFLVVPFNTVEVIQDFRYNFSDHTAFVITPDAVEPIMMSLKKIEEYEFAETLTPDERDNICRTLGKLLHSTKRRMQVDAYFWEEFLRTFSGLNALPKEFLEKVVQFERSTKMNPPQEKRAKEISERDLRDEVKLLEQDAKGRGINIGDSQLAIIETVPLHNENKD